MLMITQVNILAKVQNVSFKNMVSRQLHRSVQDLIWLGGTVLYKGWFNLKCAGLEHLPQDRGYIIAANHISHLDGPAIVAAQGKHMSQVHSLAAKDYFFNSPVKSWFCQNFLNMIPFSRRGKFLDCLCLCQAALAQKKAILFFPEGTRSKTGSLQPLKLGLGKLVMTLKVPVVPTYIYGSYQALPKGTWRPKKHPIHIRFGAPLDFSRYWQQQSLTDNRQVYRAIVDDVSSSILNLKDLEV
ncbi:MAG: lysophospholipid acyltransferase family protein [Cyanobacteria bacterium P01_F01_bin.116]